LRLLNGEVLQLHPNERVRIKKISTNIRFNHGIRLIARGLDVNALLYDNLTFATLLPNRDIFHKYKFRVDVKRFNLNLGRLDIVVEPHIEDWLDKAARTIDGDRKITILEQAREFAPEDNRIRDKLIDTYKAQKKWKQAALMLEKMATKNPDQKILYNLLEVYEATADKEGIILALRMLVDLDPSNLDAQLQLASALEKEKRLKDAITIYEQLLTKVKNEDSLPLNKTLGFLYSKTGQTKKAIASYLKAADVDKNDVNLFYNLSFLYERTGQKERANFFLAKAVNLETGDVESRLKLAERALEKGQLIEAEKYLSEVLKLKPDSVRGLSLLAKVQEKQGNKDQLKQAYRKLLFLDPKNETLIYNLGVLEHETGNLNSAVSYFKKYLKLHPKDIQVHGFLFDIYQKQNKADMAFREAQILTLLRPKEMKYYRHMFQYLNRRAEYEKMIGVMKTGLKSLPDNLDLKQYLVVAYLKTGKEDLALDQMEKILEKRKKDVTLLLQIASLHEKKGRQGETLKTYKRILDISPNHGEAKKAYLRLMLQQAKTEEQEENFKEALESYKKILDISPTHEEAADAYFRLRLKVLPVGSKES
jgi:tetratricopeptide (TPR) repeat protein